MSNDFENQHPRDKSGQFVNKHVSRTPNIELEKKEYSIDTAKNISHAESLSNYETRLEYIADNGGKKFERSVLKGGKALYDPNPKDVLTEFRRVWNKKKKEENQ